MRASVVLLAAVAVSAACVSEAPDAGRQPGRAATATEAPRIGPPADLAPPTRDPALAFRAESGALRFTSATFESSVDARGAIEMTPTRAIASAPLLAPRGAPLALETVAVARGARALDVRGAAKIGDGGVVVVRRGEVTETIATDGTAIEQSWRFERAPAGDGDVVVRVRAGGETFRGATEHGLHFDGGALGVRYGTATWIDARGARTTIVPRFVDGAIVLAVPGDLVARSAFPAVLDPTIGPERAVDAPAAVTSAPGDQYYPSLTAVGAGKGYLSVWYDNRSVRPAFFGARIASNGTVTDETGITIASGIANAQPSIYASPNGFLLLWTVRYYDVRQDPGVYALRLDANGKALDAAPVALVQNQTNLGTASAAFDGTNWLVAWQRYAGATTNYDVVAARLPASGPPLDATPIVVAGTKDAEQNPLVMFDGARFFVVYRTYATIVGQAVDKDGKLVDVAKLLASTTGTIYDDAVAFDGTRYLVAWTEYNANYEVATRRFDKQGNPTDGGAPVIVSGPASTAYMERPHVSADGTNFLVTWASNGAVYGARVAPAGGLVDGTPAMLVPATPSTTYESGSASDGAGALVIFREYGTTANGSDVFAAKVTTGSSLGAGAPFIVSKAANSETNPATAWNGTTHFAVWLDSREAQPTIWGAPIAADGSPGTAVKLLSNPDNTVTYSQLTGPRIATNGSNFLVTFSAYASTGLRGIYGMVVDGAGAVQGGVKSIAVPPAGPFIVGMSPDVAFDGTHYLVAYQEQSNDGTGIAGKLVNPDGTPVDDKVLRLSPLTPGSEQRTTPSIAFDGQKYFVAWTTTRPTAGGSLQVSHIYGTRVDKDGTPMDGELVVCGAFLLQRAPAVAADTKNGGFFVVWEDYRTSLDTADVYGGRISPQGQVVDGDKGIPISTGDADESRPTVTGSGDGTNFVVAWRDLRSKQTYDVYGAWMSVAGKSHDPQGILMSAEAGDEETPTLGVSGPGKLLLTYARLDPQTGYGSYRVRVRAIDGGKPVGQSCAGSDECASRSCVDGFCCESECDGCGTCSAQPGKCIARPAGTDSPRCTYKCKGTLDCPTECNDNVDCAKGATCDKATKKCVTRQICVDATTLQDVTGKQNDCKPYTCVGDACQTGCRSVDDCAAGFVCDLNGRCVPPPNGDDAAGCTLSPSPSRTSRPEAVFAAAAVMLAVASRRRRRAARTDET